VFHLKFGNGNVVAVDGNKLTIAFDKAGEKWVLGGFWGEASDSNLCYPIHEVVPMTQERAHNCHPTVRGNQPH